ncbi:TPA: hypothetical protein I7198_23160 [Vibrio vulnificus]|nr:hypothetical protein [Vibrio vulnificus]
MLSLLFVRGLAEFLTYLNSNVHGSGKVSYRSSVINCNLNQVNNVEVERQL